MYFKIVPSETYKSAITILAFNNDEEIWHSGGQSMSLPTPLNKDIQTYYQTTANQSLNGLTINVYSLKYRLSVMAVLLILDEKNQPMPNRKTTFTVNDPLFNVIRIPPKFFEDPTGKRSFKVEVKISNQDHLKNSSADSSGDFSTVDRTVVQISSLLTTL